MSMELMALKDNVSILPGLAAELSCASSYVGYQGPPSLDILETVSKLYLIYLALRKGRLLPE